MASGLPLNSLAADLIGEAIHLTTVVVEVVMAVVAMAVVAVGHRIGSRIVAGGIDLIELNTPFGSITYQPAAGKQTRPATLVGTQSVVSGQRDVVTVDWWTLFTW